MAVFTPGAEQKRVCGKPVVQLQRACLAESLPSKKLFAFGALQTQCSVVPAFLSQVSTDTRKFGDTRGPAVCHKLN